MVYLVFDLIGIQLDEHFRQLSPENMIFPQKNIRSFVTWFIEGDEKILSCLMSVQYRTPDVPKYYITFRS